MRCPYCGDNRTEVMKTIYRGHSSYRHRRCRYCGSRFSTQERPVRWSQVELSCQGRTPRGTAGESIELPRCREDSKWNPVEWISSWPGFAATWTTLCRQG